MAFNSVFKERHKKIHLVGIGGIGMSGIARVLLDAGFCVSGSDTAEGALLNDLRNLGATVFIGHHESHVGDADVLVFSSAVSPENPEIKKAHENNIPIIPRALMLAELMRLRCGIAVSGAHGKTTTTSLIGTLMHATGHDPTVVIGGIVNHFGSNAVLGSGQFIVTEADESDGTFLHLTPTIAVVTNIDREHLDFYEGIEQIREKFRDFLHALPFYGVAVVCLDDPEVKQLIPTINRRTITYGFDQKAQYRADNVVIDGFTASFDLYVHGRKENHFVINMTGHHNVQNTLAAIAVLEEIGVPNAHLVEILRTFNGVRRRFTPVFASDNYLVIDDYAHHPTEIKAVLAAARAAFPKRKVRVLFQPHRYTRTKDLLEEFALAFTACDSLVITEIYAASESPIEGISTQTLIHRIAERTQFRATYAEQLDAGIEKILAETSPNDVILTLGAGSVTTAAPKIAERLKTRHELR